jgi:NhaA family Na+:H+ antiporter
MARVMSKPESFQEHPIDQIVRPFQRFFEVEASSGIVLLFCTAVALIWVNPGLSDSHFELWLTKCWRL